MEILHFPTTLHNMLTAAEENGDDHIVAFQPHGRSFLIKQEEEFAERILPQWFSRLKFASFKRHLYKHGFRKMLREGPDQGAYFHPKFVRGAAELAATIERTTVAPGRRGRKTNSKYEEPDFYRACNVPLVSIDRPRPMHNSYFSLGPSQPSLVDVFKDASLAPEALQRRPSLNTATLPQVEADPFSPVPLQSKVCVLRGLDSGHAATSFPTLDAHQSNSNTEADHCRSNSAGQKQPESAEALEALLLRNNQQQMELLKIRRQLVRQREELEAQYHKLTSNQRHDERDGTDATASCGGYQHPSAGYQHHQFEAMGPLVQGARLFAPQLVHEDFNDEQNSFLVCPRL